MEQSKQCRKKVNKCQIEIITTFMETNPQLQKGTITDDFTVTIRHKKWQELCAILNSEGGAVKSVEKWQKCWSDYKSELKKKITSIKKQENDTRFSKAREFNFLDIRIAKILGFEIKEVGHRKVETCKTSAPECACLVLKEEISIEDSTSCDTLNSESQTQNMMPKIGHVFHLDKASQPSGSTHTDNASVVTLMKTNVPFKRTQETSKETDVRQTNSPDPDQTEETGVIQANSLASQQIQTPSVKTDVQQSNAVAQEAINNPHPQIQITLYTLPPQQIQMANTQAPQQIQISNTQAPQQIQMPNTQSSQQMQVSYAQAPQQIQMSNAQGSQQMQVSYTHAVPQMQISNTSAPQQIQQSNTQSSQQIQQSNTQASQQIQEESNIHVPQIGELSNTQTLQNIQEASDSQAQQNIPEASYTCTQETQTLSSRPPKRQRARSSVFPAKRTQDFVNAHQAIVGSLDKIAEEMKVKNEVAKMKLELKKEKIELERRKTEVFEKLVQHFITK